MRVFVTGATGFIGSQVVRLALREGHEVMALVRHDSNMERIQDLRKEIDWVEGDLLTSAELEAPLRRKTPDLCLHLAWYADADRHRWAHDNLDCLTGSLALLRVLHAIGCPRLLLAGTSVEYYTTTGYVSESSPISPANLYAAAKQSMFLMANHLDPQGNWKMAAARIFSLYGPWDDPRRLVPFIINKLLAGEVCELTKGEQIRDYSHVEDTASAVWAIAKSNVTGPVNVGSSQPVSVASIAERIAQLVGRPELLRLGALPQRPGDPAFLVANTERLRLEVGWKPRYDLATGLAHTIDWWRTRRAR
jgi:nucleoside-diphosphate-sugar epimerase